MNIFITEETDAGEIPIDIYSKLASDRIFFIHNFIDDKVATDIMATLMLKDSEDSEQKISLFINSEGGDLRSVFMIYDVMQIIQSPIETFCVGEAFDEAVLLLAAGTPGMRHATENSIICASQLSSERTMYSDISDARILMDRMKKNNKNFVGALSKCVNKSAKQVMADLERKKFFSAKQAQQYGLIDSIVQSSKV